MSRAGAQDADYKAVQVLYAGLSVLSQGLRRTRLTRSTGNCHWYVGMEWAAASPRFCGSATATHVCTCTWSSEPRSTLFAGWAADFCQRLRLKSAAVLSFLD